MFGLEGHMYAFSWQLLPHSPHSSQGGGSSPTHCCSVYIVLSAFFTPFDIYFVLSQEMKQQPATKSHPRVESHKPLRTFLLLLLYGGSCSPHSHLTHLEYFRLWLSVLHCVVCRVGVPLKHL